MKRLLSFLLIVTLITSGCTCKWPHEESEPMTQRENTEATVHTAVTEEDIHASSPPKKNSMTVDVFHSAATIPAEKNSGAVDSTYSGTGNSNSTTGDSAYSGTGNSNEENSAAEDSIYSDTGNSNEENSTTEDPIYSDTGIPEESEPPETEPPASTEPAEETENTSPTEPPIQATSPPEDETTVPSQPVEETPPEPEFEISYWISFAKNYAQSIGLNLDAAAVDCWDNPITAGAHCIYLERDIKNRLNRYNADEDITDVWIWAVDLGNGTYDLYIGYA